MSRTSRRSLAARAVGVAGCLVVLLALLGPSDATSGNVPSTSREFGTTGSDDVSERLWDSRVRPLLSNQLWQETRAYNAGLVLQVPLHAAFASGRRDWLEQFSEHFRRFMIEDDGVVSAQSPLNRLQYLYLASRYSVLAYRAHRPDLVAPGLVDRLARELYRLWLREPAWMWDGNAFAGGMSERVRWKLAQKEMHPSYYRAILDQEIFAMAIAADLRQIERLAGMHRWWSTVVDDALAAARDVFRQRVKPTLVGGWLMQPGVWADHPDLAYAGNTTVTPDLRPAKVTNIAEDASHSSRYALWLTSFVEAQQAGSSDWAMYVGLLDGLAIQFLNSVLVPPTSSFPSYRTRNFMDGRNGVYRWGYKSLGKNKGYGPFGLSGAFLFGWWSFLDSRPVCAAYRIQVGHFPLPPHVLKAYIGPAEAGFPDDWVLCRSMYCNGMTLLLVRLAASRCVGSAVGGPTTRSPARPSRS